MSKTLLIDCLPIRSVNKVDLLRNFTKNTLLSDERLLRFIQIWQWISRFKTSKHRDISWISKKRITEGNRNDHKTFLEY